MDHPAFAAAALPVLQAGHVDALEWSFDTAWSPSPTTCQLLDAFSSSNALYGHGVSLSLLSATWTTRQQTWLDRLRVHAASLRYRHITEHLGFSATATHIGAPLPCPDSAEVRATGIDRLRRIAAAVSCPVGLENLALALSPRDVAEEGPLLEALLAPVDGVLLLDLHNLWCRSTNFDVDADSLLDAYPLDRVREVHISGGSWDDGFRRDTHDKAIPDEVLALLDRTLPRLKNLEVVILEQVPVSLRTIDDHNAFRRDFARVREVVRA